MSNKEVKDIDENQITNTSQLSRLSLYNDESKDFLNKIAKELCDQYVEEISKGKENTLVLDLMDQYLAKKQQKPEDIINWCIKTQQNDLNDLMLLKQIHYIK